MKKLLLMAAMCCMGTMASAQSITTGIKAGLNLGTARIQEVQEGWQNDGLTAGVHAGLFTKIKLGPLYVQPEAYYTFTQAKLSNESRLTAQNNNIETLALDFHRLDVPVLLGYQVGGIFRMNAGSFASVLLNTKAESNSLTNREAIEAGAQDLYDRAAWGWQAGIGVNLLMFTVDARYETTVGDLSSHDFESNNPLNYLPKGQQQQQFILSLGYKF